MTRLRATDFPLAPEAADVAVVAIAGPVFDGLRSAPPFISWTIDFSRSGEEFGLRRSLLINDFAAQAFATRTPAAASARPILPGRPVAGAAVGVLGAGTGLGQAALLPDGNGGYLAVASEGGHAEMTDQESGLWGAALLGTQVLNKHGDAAPPSLGCGRSQRYRDQGAAGRTPRCGD